MLGEWRPLSLVDRLRALAVVEKDIKDGLTGRAGQSKQNHNKVDPQGPTKTGLAAPVFSPALLHRRVSHSNHIYLPLLPFFPFYLPSHLHPMARQDQPAPTAGPSRHRERKVQPPRPPNAWILYRSFKFSEIRQGNERLSQAAVSKLISSMWKNETEHVRRHFERLAEDKKAEHQQLYPDYRFAPQRKEDKMREKEERKQSRRAKKSKARDATPPDADADADAHTTTNATIPAPPPTIYTPQPYFLPVYQPDLGLPSPNMAYNLQVACYGPDGPSPPISAAPSPVPYESSESPEALASSSSSPFARLSPTSESQGSSSSSQLHPSLYPPSLPLSHLPSPNPYATQPLPTLLLQSSPPNELPLASPQVQLPSAPVWHNIPTRLSSLDSHNSEVSSCGNDESLRFLNEPLGARKFRHSNQPAAELCSAPAKSARWLIVTVASDDRQKWCLQFGEC